MVPQKTRQSKPRVVLAVDVPGGRAYPTKYNSHGDLARVERTLMAAA